MAEEIKVVIAPDGSFSYEVRGVKGKSCRDLTKAIDALSKVAEMKITGEYCMVPTQNQIKQGR